MDRRSFLSLMLKSGDHQLALIISPHDYCAHDVDGLDMGSRHRFWCSSFLFETRLNSGLSVSARVLEV
jgi:hypothetical protein